MKRTREPIRRTAELVALVVVAVAAVACDGDSRRGGPDAAETRPDRTLAEGTLALLNGSPVTRQEYEGFVAEVRGAGYRPATPNEARRLLDGLLRERVLDQEALRLGLHADVGGREQAVRSLAESHGGRADASPRSLRIQSDAIADELLEEARLVIDAQQLAVLSGPTDGATANGPPLPFGHPARRTSPKESR